MNSDVRPGHDTQAISSRSREPILTSSGSRSLQDPDTQPRQQSLSQFLARVLDQLSLSAWLPAAVTVFLALLIGKLRLHPLPEAVSQIGSLSAGSIVLLVGGVVLATVVTQAFEFEAIRLLEGYWGSGRIGTWIAGRRCQRFERKRKRVRDRLHKADGELFQSARRRMLEIGIPRSVVDVIEDRRFPRHPDDRQAVAPADESAARRIAWRDYAPAEERRRVDRLAAGLRQYPRTDHLVLPTRFGNTMRAYEERAHDQGAGPLEGFVQKVFHDLPASLQMEHDQFRTRLDLYCTLVVVFLCAASLGAVILVPRGWDTAGPFAGTMLVSAWLSYRAAVASARAYGGLLNTVAGFVSQAKSQEPTPATSEP